MAIQFKNPKEYIAELIGTALLVGFGCYAGAVANGFVTALIFALAFICMVYCVGGICGCHFNPIISLSMFIGKKMDASDTVFYIIAQFIGGIIGGLFSFYMLTQVTYSSRVYIYPDVFGKDLFMIDWIGCIVVEIVLGIILSYVVLKAAESKNIDMKSGAVISALIFGLTLIGFYTNNTAVNPAKSLGTAIAMIFSDAQNHMDPLIQIWMFIIFPVIGAAIGSVLYLIACSDEFDVNSYLNNIKQKQAEKKAAKAAAEAEAAAAAAEAEEAPAEEPATEEEPAEETVAEEPEEEPAAEEPEAEEAPKEEAVSDPIPEIESIDEEPSEKKE